LNIHTEWSLQPEQLIAVLLAIRRKVFDRVHLLNADFGRRNIQLETAAASKSAVLSLFLSLFVQERKYTLQVKRKEGG
jgi:hypothetical protein